MHYYEVLPASANFRSSYTLTYASEQKLVTGSLVLVPLRKKATIGIVTEATKPNRSESFTVKEIQKIHDGPPLPDYSTKLIEWIASHYGCHSSQAAQLFVPPELFAKQRNTKLSNKLSDTTKLPPPLTTEQTKATKKITSSTHSSQLLHGITGSGKTRIYIELIKQRLESNQSTILLTPEIGLTPQLLEDISPYIPQDQLFVTHSKKTAAERSRLWKKLQANISKPFVLIGPRSALFYPVHRLGLIVIDEMHDHSYKQDQSPRYQANHIAARLAQLIKGTAVFGSATPPVSDYYIFQHQKLPIIKLSKKATDETTTSTKTIIDSSLRNNFTQSAWLSNQLITNMKNALFKKQQSLLYLNRRGTARAITCQVCNWRAVCDDCDSSLVYHADIHIAVCHHCGKKQPPPQQCKSCNNSNIMYSSMGTKFLESEIKRIFPEARIIRFDGDSPKNQSLEAMFKQIRDGTFDIIIGTQTIVKGLDLPRLSVVGVLQADQSLQHPDFAAEEQLFQHIIQLIGRVGRGHSNDSHVIIQANQIKNIALQAAVNEDYHHFFEAEIRHRKKRQYPPFVYLASVYTELATAHAAQKKLSRLSTTLRKQYPEATISSPAPATQEKRRQKFRWQITIKAKRRGLLVSIVKDLPSSFRYDIDPTRLL